AVDCTMANDCTAVGHYYSADGVRALAMRTTDGTTWVRQQVPAVSSLAELRDLDCTTPTTCTAVGTYVVPATGFVFKTLVMRTTNGTSWQRVTTPNPGG